MKITLISSILNHGRILNDSGSAFALLALSEYSEEDISVITWKKTESSTTNLFGNIKIVDIFDSSHPLSIFLYFGVLLNLRSSLYLFNLFPTAYGNSNVANFIALILPLYVKKVLKREAAVIYHNSTYINDPVRLGYSGIFNKIRKFVIKRIEKAIFTEVDTYFLTETYVRILATNIPKTKVHRLRLPFFQVLGTIYENGLENCDEIEVKSGDIPRILLFGGWGPQKNPKHALECLSLLRKEGRKFVLTVAGGNNPHFPKWAKFYNNLFTDFSDVIDNRYQYVQEKELVGLFMNTDLVILPYNAPGGFSGILGFSIFFERAVIISDFPEFREQAGDYDGVVYYKEGELIDRIREFIKSVFHANNSAHVKVKERISEMSNEFSKILPQDTTRT